jgi:hypothetical protein
MSVDKRCKDQEWLVPLNPDGSYRPDLATIAVLMDIRDELKTLNRSLRREGLNLLRFPEPETPDKKSE